MVEDKDLLKRIASREEVITFLISRAAEASAGRNRVSRAEGVQPVTLPFRSEVEALCAR